MSRTPPFGAVIIEAARSFLRADGWPIDPADDGERAFAAPVEGESGRWVAVAQVPEDHDVLLFTSVLPVVVGPTKRAAVLDWQARANFGMLVGGFQVDLDTGEVRFVTSLDLTAADASPVDLADAGVLTILIRQIVYVNVMTVDRYLPSLMAVLHADADPAEVVARAEAD